MSTSRRILNEIRRTWTDRYQETNSIYITQTNPQEVQFCMFFNGSYNPLTITLHFKDRCYPFKPPNVFIGKNKKDYISLLPNSWPFSNKLLGNDCMCCSSILCNWGGPKTTMVDVINEIRHNFVIKIRLMEIAHCKKIVEKKLKVNYVPIEEFL
tara:strand:- start:1136 stop:1597 length:462 start_codon:yes stop_codon:yes gene_type:complete